jgi:hypothetical protein
MKRPAFSAYPLLAATAILALAVSATAQGSKTESQAKYDGLFSEILKNMPEADRAKVDSARKAEALPPKAAAAQRAAAEKKAAKQAAKADKAAEKAADKLAKAAEKAEDLPPSVKQKVEKAISDIEKRKAERKAEFKELDKK